MGSMTAVDYEKEVPNVLRAFLGAEKALGKPGVERSLHHLVQLRASQINRCGYCVKMHTQEARADGETSERLDRLIVWDRVEDFSERERAALAWTEALTDLESGADMAALRARLREHFRDEEIGVLTGWIAMINLWNRVNISGD